MNANLAIAVLVPVAMACLALVYLGVVVLPVFDYRFTDGVLIIRRRAFRVLPSGTWRIQLANVLRAERTGFWRFPLRGETYCAGRWWARDGVLLFLRVAIEGFERIYVTPASAESFMAELTRRLGDGVLQPAAVPTAAQRSVAVRRGDALALASGVALVAWLGILEGGISFSLFPVTPALLVVAVLCGLVFLPMVIWMWYDCVIALGERKQRPTAFWLVAMFLFFPSAWVYYLAEWRPRTSSPADDHLHRPIASEEPGDT